MKACNNYTRVDILSDRCTCGEPWNAHFQFRGPEIGRKKTSPINQATDMKPIDRDNLPVLLEARYESTAGFTRDIYCADDRNLDLIAANYIKELQATREQLQYELQLARQSRDTHKKNLHALMYGMEQAKLREAPKGRQTWWGSIVEAKTNIVVGFGVSYTMNFAILPFFGMQGLTPVNNLGITLAFTVVSIVRQLVIRRWFNGRKWGHK